MLGGLGGMAWADREGTLRFNPKEGVPWPN
jgi:hypothetical protein